MDQIQGFIGKLKRYGDITEIIGPLAGLYTWICHLYLSIPYLIASCDGCHVCGRWRLLNPEHLVVLLAGQVSHTSIQYMDFVEFFNVSLDLSPIYFIFLILVGVELFLCVKLF